MHARFTAAALMLATIAVAGQAGQPAPTAPNGNPVRGREAFVTYNCSWCHGTEGQGGLATVGPRLALVQRGLESFVAYVRKPSARMSAYSEASLPDEALADIYAYLRSLPRARPAAEIPALDQMRKPGGR